MSIQRIPFAALAASMLLGVCAAHADTPSVKDVETKVSALGRAGDPTRGAVLTELRTAFVDGDRIGTLHSGSACQAATEREWTDLVRQRVETELAQVFQTELGRSGERLSSSVAKGAPLRVQAFLNNIDVQVCQVAGSAWQGGFYAQVSWQIVAPDSGQVVYQASTEGSFTLNEPQRMATATGLREALAVAVRNLLADRRFAALLQPADQHRVALAY